ncbi:tetratricopeptide repeat protein [Rhodopirellula sp. MGV]|uniref:tetratricopeptide repeat protein n=1 Tax=Rhodopirellula sp. MGV TaxID=2023130 RepID=UPI0013040917|nr:tetratricopeptide repeat protein [Rhodopirellula sp. MGV]
MTQGQMDLLAITSNDGGDPDRVDIRFGIARMVERNGDASGAKQQYASILEQFPNHRDTQHRLGVVCIKLGQLPEAIGYLEAAAEAPKPSAELLGDLGYAYYLDRDLGLAEEKLREAILISPNDERIVNNLAIVLGEQGHAEECLSLFRRVGSEAEAQANLGFVYSTTGDLDRAKHHLHQALELDPNLEKAAKALAEFSRVEQREQPPVGS